MEVDQILVKWFKIRFRPNKFFHVISKWQKAIGWNALYLENHDQPRSISRFIRDPSFRKEGAKVLAMMLLTLRGTPYIYQGQEVGTGNRDFRSMQDIRDVESHNIYNLARKIGFPKWLAWRIIKRTTRDHARAPVDWQKDPDVLETYRDLIRFRKELPVLIYGEYNEVLIKGSLFVYDRILDEKSIRIRVAISLSGRPLRYDPGTAMAIFYSTYGRKEYDGALKPYEGIMFTDEQSAGEVML